MEINTVLLRLVFLIVNLYKYNVMAMPIKSAPVLEGRAAREFHQRWANFKDDTDPEVAKASFRKWKEYFAKQDKLYAV
jgi:hypothetical protein